MNNDQLMQILQLVDQARVDIMIFRKNPEGGLMTARNNLKTVSDVLVAVLNGYVPPEETKPKRKPRKKKNASV
jgi:hypothetical protein